MSSFERFDIVLRTGESVGSVTMGQIYFVDRYYSDTMMLIGSKNRRCIFQGGLKRSTFLVNCDMNLKDNMVGNYISIDSEYQKIEVFTNREHGKVLMLDGNVMLTERDEILYHALAVRHFSSTNGNNALVVGGGDLHTAKYLFDLGATEVTIAEIDSKVVEVCAEQFPFVDIANPGLDIIIGDAQETVKSINEKFDYIVLDLTDMTDGGIEEQLYSKEFIGLCFSKLSANGVIAVQAADRYKKPHHFNAVFEALKQHTSSIAIASNFVPCYNEHQFFLYGEK